METSQFITLIGLLGGMIGFVLLAVHREMNKMDDRWEKSVAAHRDDLNRMDAKWERLFEKLLIKENNKAGV